MAALNYASLYIEALQQLFKTGLRFEKLYNTPTNNQVRFINAKTVQIPNITTAGMVDVDRDVVGTYSRQVDNKHITLTLEHDREFKTLVDPMDIDETNMALSIANITRVFNAEHKIPEMDKYMASKLYHEANRLSANVSEETVAEANILQIFDDLMLAMDEAEVPSEGRLLYVTPTIDKVLKNAQGIERSLNVQSGGTRVNRLVYSLDDVEIVKVPSTRMMTEYNFTQGAVASATAKQIEMILVHPESLVSPQKYEFVSVDNPSATTGGKYLYYERKYWDVFIVEPKTSGIAMVVAP